MTTLIHDLYEKITNELRTLKTSKDEDQVIIKILLKRIHSLSYDVYNKNIDMDFLNKVEVNKKNRQIVINSGNKDFFPAIVRKFQRLKVMTKVAVYEKQRFGTNDYTKN